MPLLTIEKDDPRSPDIVELIEEHLTDMHAFSPPGSVHALDLTELLAPSVTFWSARVDGALVGIGAVKDLGDGTGELKSMRTPTARRRRGAGRAILNHAIAHARTNGWSALLLETGSQPEFAPARALYAAHGFVEVGPFGSYLPDPASTFMRLDLTGMS
ncbi:MAG: GNAT family N-acetyltransferase [Microbacterium sp.]